MRYFKKGREPSSLTKEKRDGAVIFGNLSGSCKSDLRMALLRDQGNLCCYCMQRISDNPTGVKIEHRRSQSEFQALQLDWNNLLAACLGGQGKPPTEQHCDTCKGDRSIVLDPTKHIIDDQVEYSADGRVVADDRTLDRELDEVLGLNRKFLCNNRRAKLDGVIEAMTHRSPGRWSTRMLQKKIRDLQTPKDGDLPEYLGVVVWWIRKKLTSIRL
ncbi:MAG: retron system putative HNH endonuclease [Polyangia bacterium]